jgi:uncharacterized protein (TIGR02145 family)
MRKIILLSTLICIVFLYTLCKKDTSSNNNSHHSVLEVNNILDEASTKFFDFAAQTNGDPRAAIYLTKDWILTQETVEDAFVDDSTYLRILLKSGLRTVYYFIDTDLDGKAKYRGSGATVSGNQLQLTKGTGCSNKIENKKVLIYVPAWNEFYEDGEIEKIVKIFMDAGEDYEVTLLRESECTVDIIKTFGNYGFVIIDTHGLPDGFKIGTKIYSDEDIETEGEMKALIIDTGGQQLWDMIQNEDVCYMKGDIIKSDQFDWFVKKADSFPKDLFVTSKFINSLPEWNKTMIFGNFCYSAISIENTSPKYYSPFIGLAFTNRNLISYFGYAFDSKSSTVVSDDFSKMMEDSLARAFVVDGDSTGNACLRSNNTEFYDFLRTSNPKLWLKQFNNKSYCYGSCGDDFADPRDGKVYKTTCIGDQVWMAENLNYNVSGSLFYDNESANGDIYGRLYNWEMIMNGQASSDLVPSGVRGICPEGWHVPSQNEWNILINYLGGELYAGGAIRDTVGWNPPNTGATNSSGFTAKPGGFENSEGFFSDMGNQALWWTSTVDIVLPGGRSMYVIHGNQVPLVLFYSFPPNFHLSCRCVKD